MKRKVILYFMTIIVLMLFLFIGLFSIFLKQYYYGGIANTLENHAETSSSFFNKYNTLFNNNIREMSGDIMDNFNYEDAELQLLSRKGEIIQSTSGFKVKREIVPIDPTVLEGRSNYSIETSENEKEKVISVYTPLMYQGQVVGVLKYISSLSQVNKMMNTLMFEMLVIGSIVAIIVFLISLKLANSFVNPIKKIIEFSTSMAKGHFKARVDEKYQNELGELAQSLNFMADEIARTDKMKNEFISSISHELRTPLTGIKGWSETLRSYDDLTKEEVEQGMTIISNETNRLIGLVEDLLDFSRLEANHLKVYKEGIQVDRIIEQAVLQLEKKAETKKIAITSELLPIIIDADPNRLKQVFLNIIDNAIKFSHVNGEITIRMKKAGKDICISIKDEGIGIEASQISKLMDKFYQVNAKAIGAGLGLSISKEIIDLHEGTIKISSKPNEGTTVSIYLPFGT